jgi:hypothetical protein
MFGFWTARWFIYRGRSLEVSIIVLGLVEYGGQTRVFSLSFKWVESFYLTQQKLKSAC